MRDKLVVYRCLSSFSGVPSSISLVRHAALYLSMIYDPSLL